MLKRYFVVTPEYGTVIPVLDDGTGPMEYSSDVIEIEAENKRDAVSLGVREMLRDKHWKRYKWCKDRRSEGVCPYTGVWAEEFLIEGAQEYVDSEGSE